jgi:predicted ATPase
MLTRVELHNFKSHQSTELNLEGSRLHALVGQNSSGKTSVLQALYYLGQLVSGLAFEDIFSHERSPKVVITSGQDQASVIAHGYSEYHEQWQISYGFKPDSNQGLSAFVSWQVGGKEKQDRSGLSLKRLRSV